MADNEDPKVKAAREAAEKAEYERLSREVGLEGLREQARQIAERKRRAAEIEKGEGRVLVVATISNYWLGGQPGRKKRTGAILSDGTPERIFDPEHPHTHYQFENHYKWIRRAELVALRKKEGYGRDFMEMVNADDGDKIQCNLSDIVDTPRGEAFLAMMERNDKMQCVKPPITGIMVRQKINALRQGKLRSPEEEKLQQIELARQETMPREVA